MIGRFVKFVKFVQFVKFVGVVLVAGVVLAGANAQWPAPSQTAGFKGDARDGKGVGFRAVEVVVDSGRVGLGAYQIEVRTPAGVEIVGLEGGESVFGEAPFYDPKALMGRRIVVAGFSTEAAGKLPTGPTRVARLHLEVSGGDLQFDLTKLEKKLVVATDADGKTIEASVALKEFQGER